MHASHLFSDLLSNYASELKRANYKLLMANNARSCDVATRKDAVVSVD